MWEARVLVGNDDRGRPKQVPRTLRGTKRDARRAAAQPRAADGLVADRRRDAGIDPRWRLHDLCHWSATEVIGRSHDIRTVVGRLGHANPAMTLSTYAHALDRDDAGVAATLASALEVDDDR